MASERCGISAVKDSLLQKVSRVLAFKVRASSFLDNDFFYKIVLNGAMKDAGMAPFKAVLDQKDATAIRAYLIKRGNEDKAAVGTASTK